MSVYITNNLDPNDIGTPSVGNLVLFSGLNNKFYYKRPDGNSFPIESGGYNSNISLNPFTYDLTITDGNGTLTASLVPLASGYFNTGLSFNTASNVLSVTDAFGSVTASLSYYEGGFNQNLSYNTASNVLSLTDGNSTLTASLTTGGANNSMTFNPFTNILSVTDGFGSVTASLSVLSSGISTQLTIPNAQVLTLNSIPITIVSAVPGYAIEVISASVKIDNPGAPYATNVGIELICSGATERQLASLSALNASVTSIRRLAVDSTHISTDTQLIENSDLLVQVPTGDPTAGDADITVFVNYRLIPV